MSIVPMREILEAAKKGGYAVGSYNSYDLTSIRGVIEAAEAERAPVILCHAPVHFQYTALDTVANLMKFEAEKTSVPVALLLDHGHKESDCVDAMKFGMNAVMMDASNDSFEDNVDVVKRIVQKAHAIGCDVEAELGHVTRPESGETEGEEDFSVIYDDSLYTQPDEAAKFIEFTGADALAVAFGTAHGVYKDKPKLDLQRLKAIRKAVDVPLVMHGGSGLSDEDFKNAVKFGIQKINYYTGMALYAGKSIKDSMSNADEQVFYHDIMMDTIASIKEDVARSMRLFGCSNKA